MNNPALRLVTRVVKPSILALLLTSAGTAAFAQATPAASADDNQPDQGEILVTARKSSEDILKTPIAITALTSSDIAARGIVSLQDVSAYTPGLKVVNNSSGRNDRSFSQVIIRGFVPSNSLAQTTSMFIDGIPVASATAIQNITDPERVEILKGPQSAYFGRQTFAGAFNVVTKAPTSRLSAEVSAMGGTRNNYDAQVTISGPLFGDVLGFRATGRAYGKDGSYRNQADTSQTLGDQSTRTGTLSLVFKPTSKLTVKGFGLITFNDDGPSAQGLISSYRIADSSGRTIVADQSNCSFGTRRLLCGVTPRLINGPSANAINDSFIKNFLASPIGRIVDPKDGPDGYGLVSRYYHLHLIADWSVTDAITLSSLTGFNRERYSQLQDLDNYNGLGLANNPASIAAGGRSYFDYPFVVERTNHDFSQEVRASYDNKGPFRLTIGASYLNNRTTSALGGGNGAIGQGTALANYVIPQNINRSITKGVFFGLGYNITSNLTINLDGRYQTDKLFVITGPRGVTATSSTFVPAGFYPGGTNLVPPETYKNFMPRAIVNWQVTPATMLYASYSKGINPGALSSNYLTQSAPVQAAAANGGFRIVVKPEKLDNFEIGAKGRLFDNRLRYAVSAYYAIWKDQLNTVTVNAVDSAGVTQIVQGTLNAGKVNMKGIEADLTGQITPELTLNASGAINDSSIVRYNSPVVTAMTGITNFKGKENKLTSKYSATAGAQYTMPLSIGRDSNAFVRVDYSFKSGVYSDESNYLRTPDMHTVNLRIGGRSGNISAEIFATNLFNNRAYTSVAVQSTLTPSTQPIPANSVVVVGLPELRTVGLRLRYRI